VEAVAGTNDMPRMLGWSNQTCGNVHSFFFYFVLLLTYSSSSFQAANLPAIGNKGPKEKPKTHTLKEAENNQTEKCKSRERSQIKRMDSFTPPSPLPVSACGEEERKEVPTDMYPGHKTLNPGAGVKLVVCEVATAHVTPGAVRTTRTSTLRCNPHVTSVRLPLNGWRQQCLRKFMYLIRAYPTAAVNRAVKTR